MNVKELREVLEEAEGILAAAGAKGQSKEFRAFLGLLSGHDHRPVSEFLAELRKRLNGESVPTRGAEERADEATVARYVQRLRDAGADRRTFDLLFAELVKDDRVGKDEADAIAHLYTGGRDKWPKKGEALRAITDWFAHEAYQTVKLKQVDKASRW